jgi:hypothetical protein
MHTVVGQLVTSVERARDALLDSVSELDEAQAAFKPSAVEWSVAEILEHLYLAEISGFTKIWAALNDARAGRMWTDALPNQGKSIEEVIDATWKPRESAPPIATPHIGGPLAAWVSALRSLNGPLRDLSTQLRDDELERVVFPHFLSGPLDARQRLEFIRFHIERHASQVRRIRASPGFPSRAT